MISPTCTPPDICLRMWHRSLHTRASGSWDIYRGGRTPPRVWYPPLWRKIFFSSTLVLRTRWIYTSGLLHVNVAIQITCYTRYKRQRKIYRIVLFFTTKKNIPGIGESDGRSIQNFVVSYKRSNRTHAIALFEPKI